MLRTTLIVEHGQEDALENTGGLWGLLVEWGVSTTGKGCIGAGGYTTSTKFAGNMPSRPLSFPVHLQAGQPGKGEVSS
jgi:hypothetical protein